MVRVYDPFNAGESMPDSPFQAEISRASEQYGVDPGLINAVIRAESNYDPNAISPVGAQGLMQLMEGTAGDLGVEDRLDPSQNIQGGTQYLAQLAERFGGDVDKTLAAYNWGIGNIDRQGIENIPPETQEYLRKVKGFMGETPKTSSSAVRIYDPFKSEALDPQSAVRTYDPFRVEKMGIPKESDSENLGEKILKGVGTASMAATQFGLGVMNWTTRVFGSDIPHTLMGWSDPKYIHAIFKGGLSEDKTRQKGEGGKAYRERIKARKFVEEKKKSISKKRQIGYDIADILFSIPSDHPVFGFEDIEKGVRKVMHPVEWTLDKIMWPGHKIVDTLIDKEKNPNAHAMFTSVSELGTFKAMHMAGKEAKWQTHKAKVRSRLREHLEKATVEDVKKVSEAGGLEGLADALREMEVKEKVPYIGDQYNAIRAAKVAADNTKGLAHAERQRSIKEAIDKVAAEAEKPEPKPTPKPLRTGVTAEEFMAGIKKEVPDAEKITQAVREVGKEERIEREAEGPVRVRDIEEGRKKAEGEEIAKSLGEEVGGEISFDGEVEGLYYFTPKADIGGVAETRGATFATREPTIEAARESLKKIVDMRRPKEKAKFRIMRDDWPDTFGIGEGEKAGRIQEYFPETDEWKDVTGRTIGSNTETAWEAANRRLAEFIGMSEGTVKKFPVKEPKGITKLKNLFAETRSVRTVEAPKLDIIEGGKEEIPTFTQKKLAEDAGYTVVKQIHKTFEKAEKQRKRLAEEYGTIEGQEPPVVIKTGKSYRVATKETPLLDAEAEALVSEYFKEGEKTPYEEAETISTEEAMDRVKEIGEKILERTEEGGLKLKEGLNTNQHINEVKSLASMLDPNNPTHSNIIDFSEMILDKLGPRNLTRKDFLKKAEAEPDTTNALRFLMKALKDETGAIEIGEIKSALDEISSVFDKESELLKGVIGLHFDNKVEADFTYSKGAMWKNFKGKEPTKKFDLTPQTKDTIKADISKHIPAEENSIESGVFDPPFLIKPEGLKKGMMVERFTSFPNINSLWKFYKGSLKEIKRVLKPGGKLLVKIQDVLPTHQNYFSAAEMYNMAVAEGFVPVDRAILYSRRRMPLAPIIKTQKHFRKSHVDYWVFKKPFKKGGKYKHPVESPLSKIVDIVRNEKGAIEIERLNPEMQERLRKVIADSLKVGKPVKEYMKDLGYDEKTASTFDKASELFKEKRPIEELDKKVITPMEEGVNVSSRKSRKVRGIEVNYLPVFYEELKTLMKSKELQERTGVGEYFRNPIRAFREAGSGLKKMIYEPYVNAEKLVVRDLKAKETTIKALRKGISRRSAKRIWKYAMAQQTGGPEIMAKMKIKKIPESLTPKEMKAYEGLRAEYDILFDRLNNVRTSIGKNPIRKVGDYFTFMSALSMLEKLGIKTNLILDRPSVIRDRYTQFKATPFRFARARAKAGMAPVVTDPFVIYSRYANSAIRHLHISPIVAKVGELRRVFKLEDGSNWKLGASNQKPRLDKFLLDWSNFLAGQTEFKLPPRIERALGMINRNLTYSVLGANARSALIQISASKNTFVEIGATHTAKGWVSSLRPGAEARILKKSNLEQRVYDAVVGDAMAALKTGKVGGVKKVIASGAMWPLKYLDLRTAMATWDGAYKLAKDKMKMGENRAVEYANDVVTRTQASALQGDLAPVQRTALGKFMTLFQTFVINDWNFLTEDVLGMKNAKITNPIAVKKVLKFIAATTMTNVLFEDIIGVKSPLPTPLKALMKGVEDEDSTGRIALSIFMEMLEPIPVVSSARYGTSPFGPGVETIGELTKLMRDYPMQKPWYETLGKLMGVPGTTQVMKTKRAIERDASTKEKVFGAKYQPKKRRKKRPTSSGL